MMTDRELAPTARMMLSPSSRQEVQKTTFSDDRQQEGGLRVQGFTRRDAIHAVDRLGIAGMSLSKAPGLPTVAKDAAAIENTPMGEALKKLDIFRGHRVRRVAWTSDDRNLRRLEQGGVSAKRRRRLPQPSRRRGIRRGSCCP